MTVPSVPEADEGIVVVVPAPKVDNPLDLGRLGIEAPGLVIRTSSIVNPGDILP